jgi:hypothetical protein
MSPDISKEYISSIFRIEEKSQARNQLQSHRASGLCNAASLKVILLVVTALRASNAARIEKSK